MCNNDLQKAVLARLSSTDIIALKHSAKIANKVEVEFKKKIQAQINKYNEQVLQSIIEQKPINKSKIDFTDLFLEHAFDSMKAGIKSAQTAPEDTSVKLAKLPPVKIPRSFRELMIWWDLVRKEKAPKRIQILADIVKKKYIDKCQKVYQKYSEEFREGKVYTQEEVKADLKKAADTTKARADMIVNTETTRYYNQVRTKIYDASESVTHYLFVSIRDYRTTKWCKTRAGLVFKKGTALYKKNIPSVHWNCRSEMLPLTPYNPNHLKLINDKSLKAENNKLEPLPEGWNE